MGLAEQQRLLARLYTDAPFRERFLADPRGIGEAQGLSPQEAALLACLPFGQVQFFARSLQRKRLAEIRKVLPATHQALGPSFGMSLQRFAGACPASGAKRHHQEAVAFAKFLGRARSVPDWIVDLARYEAAWVQAAALDRGCILRWFRYPLRQVLRGLSGETVPALFVPQRTVAIWFRPSRWAQLRHGMWSLPAIRRVLPALGKRGRADRTETVRAS